MNETRKRKLVKAILKDIYSKFGFLSVFLALLMAIVALIEGLSYTLLFPLLNVVGIESGTSQNIFARFFDRMFRAFNITPTVGRILSIVVLIALLQYVIAIFKSRMAAKMQHDYIAIWRKNIFSNFIKSQWPFFLKSKQSDLINTIINETGRIGGAFYLISQITSAFIVICIYFTLSLAVSWEVTFIMLSFVVILYPLVKQFISYGHELGNEISEINSKLQFESQEYLGGVKVIKATVTEDRIIDRFFLTIDEYKKILFHSSFMPSLMKEILDFFGIGVFCLVLFVCFQVLKVDFADIAVIFFIFLRFTPRVFAIQQNISALFVYLPSVSVLKESEKEAFLNKETDNSDINMLEDVFSRKDFKVKIDNLSFSYHKEIGTLSDISIDIVSGKTIAIVGSSGSGKSTLVDCMLRLLEPVKGNIYFNGIDIKNIPLESWRKMIGYVSQDTFLFNDSIRSNITWGNFDAEDMDIIEAAKLAGAHDFILKLPKGYDAIVGDRGIRVSGGERQRIGLARALISKPKLLLLDEPTSNLDSESEKYVKESIENLFGKITVAVITHRFSTVRDADYVYVLENGKIVEEGSWEDLLKLKGRFKYLWDLQKK